MKYFWTLFWTFLLVEMLTYVVSSMIGSTFDFVTGAIVAAGATILILVLSAIIPEESAGKQGLH
ncbi:YjzD family protein [Bacillus infantis]|uniref:YjzD family protein n=1 Tax=Bacillus infantis TaxID=324767 RepID=UPI001CD5E834|nr:YjzD family protein [Bacillus infantis]MCA1039511.1 YjzD family protein [Bacillus infantis]MCR6610056.1 YjzD family protein [Bacillus infantis]